MNLFDRLALKIELSKKRQASTNVLKEGFSSNDKGQLTFKPPYYIDPEEIKPLPYQPRDWEIFCDKEFRKAVEELVIVRSKVNPCVRLAKEKVVGVPNAMLTEAAKTALSNYRAAKIASHGNKGKWDWVIRHNSNGTPLKEF